MVDNYMVPFYCTSFEPLIVHKRSFIYFKWHLKSRIIDVSKDTPYPKPIHPMIKITSVLGQFIKN
ncbi:hypothetical protein AM501_02755 [Aneurinibacillus migulanus]|nr:hypothetical protein TS64_09040 [Aneurinibacillus migulanus]KPD09713.1 hypothetical protein AM501_02755 [Aneurinibacillus migulanus]